MSASQRNTNATTFQRPELSDLLRAHIHTDASGRQNSSRRAGTRSGVAGPSGQREVAGATIVAMALYEYRCRVCDQQFDVRRSMHDADTITRCPAGHDDTVCLLSMFATVSAGSAPAPVPSGGGGGCCGGACGCAH